MFGTAWSRLSGVVPNPNDKKGMMRGMGLGALGSFITAYILTQFLGLAAYVNGGNLAIAEAFTIGILVWIGFIATTMLDSVLWEKKPWALFGINAGYRLVAILAMAGILIGVPW
jgi:hypothetical protein